MKLDIGGGTYPADGYVNFDPVHGDGAWKRPADLCQPGPNGLEFVPWPADDGTVEAVRASHVMEHIAAGAPRIWIFNEAHRVLGEGGTFQIIVPLVGTWHAIADPTHVSLWVPESFNYFDGTQAAHADYGIAPWETLDFVVYHGWEGHWLGRPVKDFSKDCECERWRDGITVCPVHGTVKDGADG